MKNTDRTGVVTDSHSSISQEEAKKLGIMVLPMPFYIGEDCYYEGTTLSRQKFFERLDSGAEVSTSQPSPVDVMKLWDEALSRFSEIVYIPISSGLSGSCSAAYVLSQEEKYKDKVYVVDNGRVSTPLHQSVLDALELVEEGYSGRGIKQILENAKEKMVIYIGVQTLEHLKRGGRISPAAAALGTVLQIKPVLKLGVGALDVFHKCRGFGKAKQLMIEAVKRDLETTFKGEYERGEVSILAASSASEEETGLWIKEIEEAFPGKKVLCDDLSLGVSCHIGYGALGIGCSVRPERIIK